MNLLEMRNLMEKSIQLFEKQTSGIGHGVGPGLINNVKVKDQTGSMVPLETIAVTSQKGNMISIAPFDPSMMKTIEETLKGCGMNAFVFSKREVAVSVPQQSKEESDKMLALVKKMAEEAKVAIRNIRKRARQESIESKDLQKKRDKEIDNVTEQCIGKLDSVVMERIE